jgi:hypothetical protein
VKPVTLKEIIPFEQYEILRPRLRPLFIAEKERRRLAVGEHLTLLFENGQTVWYQVEEMIRSERISAEEAQRDAALRELVGLERHLWIRIGELREHARFDTRQIATDRISAVQFVRFPLGGLDQQEFLKFAAEGKIAIEADHPKLNVRAPIAGPIAISLARDLADT